MNTTNVSNAGACCGSELAGDVPSRYFALMGIPVTNTVTMKMSVNASAGKPRTTVYRHS